MALRHRRHRAMAGSHIRASENEVFPLPPASGLGRNSSDAGSPEVEPGQSAQQFLRLEGLWNDIVCPKRLGHSQIIDISVPCTARNSDDLDLRTLAPDLKDRFDTLLLRHNYVGDHDIGALVAEDGHRTLAVRGGRHMGPVAPKDFRKRLPDPMDGADSQNLHGVSLV